MKIYNSPIAVNSQHTNFKAISPVAQKQLKSVIKSPVSKDLFAKVAGVAGLSSIIAWVNSFKKSENKVEELNKLDVIDTAWTQKSSERILNPEQSESFLNLVSEIDENESLLWTKALLSDTDKDAYIPKEKASHQSAKEMFLTNDANELFMETSANRAINSIMMQLNAISGAENEENKNNLLDKLNLKFNSLVKQAEELQNNEETSELYSKLTNIVKTFIFINLLEKTSKETKIENSTENTPIEIEPIVTEDQTLENPTEEKVEEVFRPEAEITPTGLKVIGKIELKEDKSTPKRKQYVNGGLNNETPYSKLSEENKKFVDDIFNKAFKKTSPIKPDMYYDFMDSIKKIYSEYEEKEKIAELFLKILATENRTLALDNFLRLNADGKSKINFINFLAIEDMKNKNGGRLNKEEFDILNNYKDATIKYFKTFDEKIEVAYIKGISAEKRLEFIKDLYLIAFNKTEDEMFNGVSPEKIDKLHVLDELSYRIAKNEEDYPNILAFLGVDVKDLQSEIYGKSIEDSIEIIKDYLSGSKYSKNINSLVEILNNEDFDFFIDRPHARMRVLERFVFNDTRNLFKEEFQINKKVSSEIKKIKTAIERNEKLYFTNYEANCDSLKSNDINCGPRIQLRDYTIGINAFGQIHTIW